MSVQTIKDPSDWLQLKLEQGWSVLEEQRSNEPIFSEDGQSELVWVTEYHLEDEDGGYAGVLSVTVGAGWTDVEFVEFSSESYEDNPLGW